MMDQDGKNKKFTIRWEKWTAIGTILMAICAVVTSLWQGYLLQKHNQLSIRPYLEFEINVDTSTTAGKKHLVVWLNNNGLGPANVTEVDIFLGEEQLTITKDIWKKFEVEGNGTCDYGYGSLEHFYRVDHKQLVLRTTSENCQLSESQINHLLKALEVHVYYEDLYGNQYTSYLKN